MEAWRIVLRHTGEGRYPVVLGAQHADAITGFPSLDRRAERIGGYEAIRILLTLTLPR